MSKTPEEGIARKRTVVAELLVSGDIQLVEKYRAHEQLRPA
jgi:hypothetical protein